MYIKKYSRRFHIVFLSFLAFFVLLIARLFYIQFFRSHYLSSIAKKQQSLYIELEPQRGFIYDASMRPLAINIAAESLYAVPREIRDKEKTIQLLSPILGVEQSYLKERIYKNKSFVWIVRKVTPLQAEKIKSLKMRGLGFIKENRRAYPNGYLATHILGLTDIDNLGLTGAEIMYERYLKGQPGWAFFLRDARQNRLNISEHMLAPKDGLDVVLNIDEVIQFIAERELDRAFKKTKAKSGSIVVLDPHSGRVLALANRPTFDPNYVSLSDAESRRDRAICNMFEPGSVFKIITAAAAIEENIFKENDKFFCENGNYPISGHVLHDHIPHGWLTFKEVFEQSSNIGTTKIAQAIGPEAIYHYAKLFGIGHKTGIDLPGEVEGIFKDPKEWSKLSIGAIPIGQEVAVNIMQLAVAMAAIANGGYLMKPHVAARVQDKQQNVIKEYHPVIVRKVISTETAERVKMILRSVVENGSGKLARLEGFTAAGKTGTAQKLEQDGTYSHRKFIASFIGFAPADDPVLVIAVSIDEPRPYYFGGVVAAPVFKNVAEEALKYLKNKELEKERFVSIDAFKRTD